MRKKGELKLDRSTVAEIHGYFAIEQCFSNATRTGDSTNMIIREYQRRKALKDGYFSIKVGVSKNNGLYEGHTQTSPHN